METTNNVLNEFKKFIIDNNIVGTSAGVCVALAAKDGIQSLVSDLIIPAMIILLHNLKIDNLSKYLPKGEDKLNINNFIKSFVTFVLIIFISFIFVKFAFEYLLGIKKESTTNKNTVIINNKKNVSNKN